MFLSPAQIRHSLKQLEVIHPFFGMSFLAFKLVDLPVGATKEVVFSEIADTILQRFYRVSSHHPGFYNPFITSNPEKRWVALRYPSTSLQRITTDTFGDALIHEKGTSFWGWKKNYVANLQRHLKSGQIPAFDLAVWLFRDRNWSRKVTRNEIRDALYDEFNVNGLEQSKLFDEAVPDEPHDWLAASAISESQLLEIVGQPASGRPKGGALLQMVSGTFVGPPAHFEYEPGERLNLITGDNALGKTFLLDVIWWALTGSWCSYPALPREDAGKGRAQIEFQVREGQGQKKGRKVAAKFDWSALQWREPERRQNVGGLVIYSRYNGAFGVFDPIRAEVAVEGLMKEDGALLFTADEIRNGLERVALGRPHRICNGLLLDWILWQTSGELHRPRFDALKAALSVLSPSPSEPIVPGKPQRRAALGTGDVPTVLMPYGEVPVPLLSAGIQRIIVLAYVVVWAWFEHCALAAETRTPSQKRIVLLVDELEAHLHPRWQRVIVPALLRLVSQLDADVSELTVQIHAATHSPLVLASAEADFDDKLDRLFHLEMEKGEVSLREVEFTKLGKADRWLVSDVIGLDYPRPIAASEAIEAAKQVQGDPTANRERIANVHKMLLQQLPQDDDFWPRWLFFAQQAGVET